jgi:TPR repeat protein
MVLRKIARIRPWSGPGFCSMQAASERHSCIMETIRVLSRFWRQSPCIRSHLLRGTCAIGPALIAAALLAGPASADYEAGLRAYSAEDYKTAFSEWDAEAKTGDARAEHGLGVLYERGLVGGKVDMPSAIRWYQAAAKQGFADAENNLAMIYLDGRGVARNPKQAVTLWTKAAESGNSLAMFNLGVQYLNGGIVTKNEKHAAELITQAAQGNLSQAQFILGILYREGTGVPKDSQQSTDWLKRAADNGNAMAKSELTQGSGATGTAVADAGANTDAMKQPSQDGAATATKPVAANKTDTPAPTTVPADNGAATKDEQASPEPPAATDTADKTTKVAMAASADAPAQPADSKSAQPASTEQKPIDQSADTHDAKASDQKVSEQKTPGQNTADQKADQKPADEKLAADKAAADKATADKSSDQAAVAKPGDQKPADADKPADKPADKTGPSGNDDKDLAAKGLKKSVTDTPAFAVAENAGKTPELAAPQSADGGKSDAQDANAAAGHDQPPADKPADAGTKDAAKPATAGGEGTLASQTSGGAGEKLAPELPVAESLNGSERVYRIWLASKGTQEGAQSEWDRLLQKYPGILKKLAPDIRQYYFNEQQGSVYRLFVGPFTSLEAAQKTCGDIHERYQQEFCRTVIN